jgi:hypothetical protein
MQPRRNREQVKILIFSLITNLFNLLFLIPPWGSSHDFIFAILIISTCDTAEI